MTQLSTLNQISHALQQRSHYDRALASLRFHKTGPGEYGEGDQFLGVTGLDQRLVAKQYYKEADLSVIEQLLKSSTHEYRSTGLMILTYQFPKATLAQQHTIFQFYLDHSSRINNWDLVDISAPNIVGEYMLLTQLDMTLLKSLAGSALLWERRISIITTLAFIRAVKKKRVDESRLDPSLELSTILLQDSQDLMHKAVGWVLREVGKVDESMLRVYLNQHASVMPRTTLRYAIEKFDETSRQQYLHMRSDKLRRRK